MPTATLNSKGQITIPLEIRKALGLHAGAILDFVLEQDGFNVRPLRSSTATLKGRFSGRIVRTISIAEMDVLDDLELIPALQQRIATWQSHPDNVIEVSRDELKKMARGTTSRL